MKYEVNYNQSGRREFANVTFENGQQVSYEIIRSQYEDPTLRICRGSLQKNIIASFDNNKLTFEEMPDTSEGIPEYFTHKTFGDCQYMSENGTCSRINILATGEIKMIYTPMLIKNIVK